VTKPQGSVATPDRLEPGSDPAAPRVGLRPNSLGFPPTLAQSIALISPTMTAVLIIPLAFSDAGQGTWLAYLFGTVMLLFVVLGLNQFASRSSSPGSMYSYTGKGLGPACGVVSGWALMWCYLFIGIAGLAGFSIFANQVLQAIGLTGTVPGVFLFATSAAICWFVAYKDIRISSLLMLGLEAVSVALIIGLAFVVLFRHGLTVDSHQLGLRGVSIHGLSFAVVITIFSLVGFESATTLGGEVRDPLKTIPKAVVWSLLLTGAFMVFMAYVEVFATRHSATSLANITAPLNTIATIYKVSAFKVPISLGAMVSFFSLSLSCLNAGSRIIFPMGRHGIFPARVGDAHPVHQTPYVAISGFIVVMFAVPSVLQIWTNPLTTFNDAGTLAAFGFLLAYFMIAVAAPVYLHKRGELRPRHVVIAVAGFLCLLVPLVGSFYPAPPWPVDTYPYIFGGYMLVGGLWLFLRSRSHAGILTEIEADLEHLPELVDPTVAGEPTVIDMTDVQRGPAPGAVTDPASGTAVVDSVM
jgi:amino acid transporter